MRWHRWIIFFLIIKVPVKPFLKDYTDSLIAVIAILQRPLTSIVKSLFPCSKGKTQDALTGTIGLFGMLSGLEQLDDIFFCLRANLLGTFYKLVRIPVAQEAVLGSKVIIYSSVPKEMPVPFVIGNTLVPVINLNLRLTVK